MNRSSPAPPSARRTVFPLPQRATISIVVVAIAAVGLLSVFEVVCLAQTSPNQNQMTFPSGGAAPLLRQESAYHSRQDEVRNRQNKPQHVVAETQVSFAGGAVLLTVPFDWEVTEIAVAREIRLVVAPQAADSITKLRHGFWIAYRYAPQDATAKSAYLDLETRLTKAPKSRRRVSARKSAPFDRSPTESFESPAGSIKRFTIQNMPAVRQSLDFEQGDLKSNQPSRTSYHCARILARCGEAVFELRTMAPVGANLSAEQIAEHVLRRLVISPPPLQTTGGAPLQPTTVDASPILGSWKSLGSQLSLRDDGRVRLRFDQEKSWLLTTTRPLDSPRPIRQITGTFRAEGDLVRIQWDDGSRLNYRWRLADGKLYLTDHLGRVSQLHRLYQ